MITTLMITTTQHYLMVERRVLANYRLERRVVLSSDCVKRANTFQVRIVLRGKMRARRSDVRQYVPVYTSNDCKLYRPFKTFPLKSTSEILSNFHFKDKQEKKWLTVL
jgi:hypothetical protein